jgi:acetyl-CoA carboxylase carboxyltransferase component
VAPSGGSFPAMAIGLRAGHQGVATAAVDHVDGVPAVVAAVAGGERGGGLTGYDGDTLVAAAEAALDARLPLVLVLSSSGADVDAGMDGLRAWGRAAAAVTRCSGVVPVVAAAVGPVVSGSALLLGLADQVVMTAAAYAFVSGPTTVEAVTGQRLDAAALGGAAVHARSTGVASLLAGDADEALALVGALLGHLPPHTDVAAPPRPTADPPWRPTPEAGDLVPATATGSYDVRDVVGAVVDDGDLLELRSRWAPNLVTALAAVGGRRVGVVANQPQSVAGTLDIPSSQKGARFVGFCDAFNLPLLTFVDTPGFYPGKDLEWRGMIRHGAQLAFAYARATVPRLCVVLRKAYGGAYIVMDSATMGSDLCLAWPSAEVAVMGAKGAVEILHRREPPDVREAREAEYAERLLNPYVAAERGLVDAVIDPADTRRELATALDLLADKQERLRPRRHDNGPL